MYDDAMAIDVTRFEDTIFQQVLGEPTHAVEEAVLSRQLVGETSLHTVVERFMDLFGVGKGEALDILGVSRTKLSRNPTMSVGLLDQAGSILKTYARVANIRGPEAAARWFTKANRHLDGKPPLALLETGLGRERLNEYVTALEDGVFL